MAFSQRLRAGLKDLLAPQLNQHSLDHLLPRVTPSTQGIPRNLFHVFVGGEMPAPLRANVDRMVAANPSWVHSLVTDATAERFIRGHYGDEVLRRYQRIDPSYAPARADLLRYLLVYAHGGVYMDVKAHTHRPLHEAIRGDDECLLAYWPDHTPDTWKMHDELRPLGPRGELQMWFLAATAGHPYLRQVIGHVLANVDRYSPALHATGKKGVVRVTGPIAYTLAIAPLLEQERHRLVDTDALGWHPSFLASKTAHESIGRAHYSTLTAPVVRTGALRRWLGRLVAARRAR